MSDVDRYTEVIDECVREMVGDDEAYEVVGAWADANREVREHHQKQLDRFQSEVDRRAAVLGEAFEQVMQLAAEAET